VRVSSDANVAFDLRGIGTNTNVQDDVTNASDIADVTNTSGSNVPSDNSSAGKQVVVTIVAVIIGLIVLKYLSEHEKAGMEMHLISIGVWNWIIGGLMVVLFIVCAKTIVNKYNVPVGLRNFINAA
jgi:hypothetical protein